MSANRRGGGVNPSYTIPQFQKLLEFAKELLAESPLVKTAIIMAGVGGLVELLHTVWLAIRYLAKF
jgi:hypothetical protein